MLIKTRYTSAEFKKAFPKVVLNYRAWPKRKSDRQIILLSIAAFFDLDRTDYREADVNDLIMTWNAHFGGNLNLDHVTLRRELVDARILNRTDNGTRYSIIPDDVLDDNVGMIRSLNLDALVADEIQRRAQVRQRYKNSPTSIPLQECR